MIDLSGLKIKVSMEENNTYYAEVINLPGCFTYGDTLEELNKNLKEAILSYLGSLEKDLESFDFNITNNDIQAYA